MSGSEEVNQFHWKSKAYTNLYILLFVILVVVNTVLIVAFQIWFVYRIEGPVTPDTIASLREDYVGCTILDSAQGDVLQSYLLSSGDGGSCLVTLEKHPYTDRYRVVKKGTAQIPAGEDSYTDVVSGDSATVSMAVESGKQFSRYSENTLFFERGLIRFPYIYLMYGILMILLEFAAIWGIGQLRKP